MSFVATLIMPVLLCLHSALGDFIGRCAKAWHGALKPDFWSLGLNKNGFRFAQKHGRWCLFLLMILPIISQAQTPSFPGAEGYGSTAAGGRGGDVYIVSNLNASGAGSFAEAISTAPVAGRTIVFAVSGHIRLPSGSGGTTMSKSKITIAGQTAPGDGICLWNNTLTFSGDDVVVRHLRFRYGKQAAGGDAVDVASSQRIIFDHCDMMFSTDENFSTFGTPPEFMTYQWSVNAWGLQTHSAGGLWDLDHATAHHTLWANNHTRNPKCIAPSVLDWTNNVVFGWNNPFNMAESSAGGVGIMHRVNIRGSWFIHGGSTGDAVYGGGLNTDGSNKFKLHMADTALDGTSNGVLNASKTNYAMVSTPQYDVTSSAWPQSVNGDGAGAIIGTPVTVQSRSTALKQVLSQAGALRMAYDAARPLRDELTQLCVTRVMAHQRGIITDPLELGISTGTAFAQLSSTPAPLDTDRDGMPDFYESALGMNVSTASHNTVFPSSGGIITASTFFPANARRLHAPGGVFTLQSPASCGGGWQYRCVADLCGCGSAALHQRLHGIACLHSGECDRRHGESK
jgi:hypothetical protein